MLLVLLLVALFIAAMWVMSSLNLDYSQRAMAELRRGQIEDSFYANLGRINGHHRRMEQHTEALARLGELLQRNALGDELAAQLEQKLRDFPDAFGVGLWFEPGRFPALGEAPGIYAHWGADRRIEVSRQAGDRASRTGIAACCTASRIAARPWPSRCCGAPPTTTRCRMPR